MIMARKLLTTNLLNQNRPGAKQHQESSCFAPQSPTSFYNHVLAQSLSMFYNHSQFIINHHVLQLSILFYYPIICSNHLPHFKIIYPTLHSVSSTITHSPLQLSTIVYNCPFHLTIIHLTLCTLQVAWRAMLKIKKGYRSKFKLYKNKVFF